MFKRIINSFKMRKLTKLLNELCNRNACVNCAAYLKGECVTSSKCAQYNILTQAEIAWGFTTKEGYCPICDRTTTVRTDASMCKCPTCGHDICLHEPDKE